MPFKVFSRQRKQSATARLLHFLVIVVAKVLLVRMHVFASWQLHVTHRGNSLFSLSRM